MCTITYIPHQGGYILTQNRDESPLRADAIFPIEDVRHGNRIIFPQDPEGQGSWFVSVENGVTLCVMNGIFHPDKKPGQFRHSRGLIPLHYLKYANTFDFLERYQFEGLEGFKLLACSEKGVDEIKWDEHEVSHARHAPSNLIFQSDPLYNAEQKKIRQNLFQRFLSTHQPQDILDFHTQPQTDDPTIDILMNRGKVGSVSTIQRVFNPSTNVVGYLKLGASQVQEATF